MVENVAAEAGRAQAQKAPLMAEQAREALWCALRDGVLRDGEFLSMSQLVEILGCPIAPTREAVKQASSLGLLSTVPKRGLRVMEARPQTIRDCLDLRMVLDQEGARRRIARNALDGLEALRQAHQAVRGAVRDGAAADLPPRAIRVDLALHDFLAAGLENARLEADYDTNRMRIAIIQNARPFVQDRIASAMEEHLAIMEAMARADAEATVEAIRFHCERTMQWWGVG